MHLIFPSDLLLVSVFFADSLRQPESAQRGRVALACLQRATHSAYTEPLWKHAPWKKVPTHYHGMVRTCRWWNCISQHASLSPFVMHNPVLSHQQLLTLTGNGCDGLVYSCQDQGKANSAFTNELEWADQTAVFSRSEKCHIMIRKDM